MVDSCATCFFARTPPASAGLGADVITCNKRAPGTAAFPGSWPWGIVDPDFWCGDGADDDSGASFSATITSVPSSQGLALPSLPWSPYSGQAASSVGLIVDASANGFYIIQGKTVSFKVAVAVTDNGTGAGTLFVPLPVPSRSANQYEVFAGWNTFGQFACLGQDFGTVAIVQKYEGSYPVATGDGLLLSGAYEAA